MTRFGLNDLTIRTLLTALIGFTAIDSSAEIILRGVVMDGAGTYLSFYEGQSALGWKNIGDNCAGFKVAGFDPATETATLIATDGREKKIRLESARTKLADADRELASRAREELHQRRPWFPTEQFWRAADASERASFIQAFSEVGWELFVDERRAPMVVLLTSKKYRDSAGRPITLVVKGEDAR